MVLNWFFESEEVFMLQMVSRLILKLSLFLVTAVSTRFGHAHLGRRSYIIRSPTIQLAVSCFAATSAFHHTHYAEDHLVSRTCLGDEGNVTPYFVIPGDFQVGGCVYFLLPLNLFVVTAITSAASFYAHVFFDKEYHVEGSRLQRFTWFRRLRNYTLIHTVTRIAMNFGVIHFFTGQRFSGTYRVMPWCGCATSGASKWSSLL